MLDVEGFLTLDPSEVAERLRLMNRIDRAGLVAQIQQGLRIGQQAESQADADEVEVRIAALNNAVRAWTDSGQQLHDIIRDFETYLRTGELPSAA